MLLFSLFACSTIITAVSVNSSPRYIVLAPKTIRPDIIYRVVVILFVDEFTNYDVRVTITYNKGQIATSSTNADIFGPWIQAFPLKIPTSIKNGKYSLNIEAGRIGSPAIKNSTQLQFMPSFVSITVQTNRPIYQAGQKVLFRILILHIDLRPFNDAVEVHLLDPDGFIMKRWISVYTNNGVASLNFKLPNMTKDGFWKIKVKAWDQVEEQMIKVETYFSTLFEIHINLLPYYEADVENIKALVTGLYTSEEVVKGNATFKISARKYANDSDVYQEIWKNTAFIKHKNHEINFPIQKIKDKMDSFEGLELRLDITLMEFLNGETVSGYSITRIIPSEIKIKFLNAMPAIFRAGMPFQTQVALSYHDNEKIPEEILTNSQLRVQATLYSDSGGSKVLPEIIAGLNDNSVKTEFLYDPKDAENILFKSIDNEQFLTDGVLPVKFDTEENTTKIDLSVSLILQSGKKMEAKIEAEKHFTNSNKFLGVYSYSTDISVGDYAVFHVKSNFILDSFQYLISSKNQILYAGQKSTSSPLGLSISSLAFPVSPEMAPGFRLLILHRTLSGEIITDTCYVPVDGFSRFEMEIEVNTGKDLKADRVELRTSGEEGAFIGVNSIRSAAFKLQAGNEITRSRVIDSLVGFEMFKSSINKINWKSRDGRFADESIYYPSMDFGMDTNRTFLQAGLIVLTTENIANHPNPCKSFNNISCLFGECYSLNEICHNLIFECENGADIYDCNNIKPTNDYEYKLNRMNRYTFFYDKEDGDWGWREIKKNDHVGIEFEPMWPPQVVDDWYFTGFTVGKDSGLTIFPEPVLFSYKKPFTMHVSGPSFCHRGEQLGIRVVLANNHHLESLILVELKGSSDYKFVHVEEGGIVSSYNARLSSGNHQILVYLAPASQEHIDFPVAPTIEQGDVEIKFLASTQTGKSESSHFVRVLGEGALITRHTSEFIDLKNKALSLIYLKIIVEESPLVSYQEWRRYVFGSTSAYLTLTGDLIGPTFPQIPITMKSMLDRYGKGTESRLFEMAANIWTLHYLRLTNQLKGDVSHSVLNEINVLYNHVMKRFNPKGWFYNWNQRKPNLWLTAWAIRIFRYATFPDWENVVYIDPEVFKLSVQWILRFQSFSGCFNEYTLANYIDSKFFSNITEECATPLTAHVLITLSELLESGLIVGDIRSDVVASIQGTINYLERQLSIMTDPYLISLTAYALIVSKSDLREQAFLMMQKSSRQNNDGLIYWSRKAVDPNPIKKENQRPFKQPRIYHEGDSVAVEATAWALLVNLQRDGVTDFAEKIVQWLTTIRMTCSGFISTVDTIVALQALTEYAFRSRLLDITNISVTVDMPKIKFKKNIFIKNSSFQQPTIVKVPSVWGHVNVVARGSGLALVQMDVNYGIDHEPLKDFPSVPSFDLRVREYYSIYRNKSAVTIESCFRWIRKWPHISGAAVLEVELPTGYHLVESQAENLIETINHPTLQDAKTVEGKTLWFFEYINQTWSCFNHTVRRWYPVANMTLHRQAILYEITARERFEQVLVNSTPLYILNICEVCGSYQCPYCPFYNHASSFNITCIIPIVIIIFNIYCTILLY